MDAGTENIYCQDLLVYWSRLKKYERSWGIDFFTDMAIKSIFKPDKELHEELLLFVFMPILQNN